MIHRITLQVLHIRWIFVYRKMGRFTNVRSIFLLFLGFVFLNCEDSLKSNRNDCGGHDTWITFDSEGGYAYLDSCGVCDDDSLNDCLEDCAGEWGGSNICGCTDSTAINYLTNATFDDGSCEYDTTIVFNSREMPYKFSIVSGI